MTAYLGSGSDFMGQVKQWVGPGVSQAVSSVFGKVDLSNANLILGAVLLAFVLLVPEGVVPTIFDFVKTARA